MAKAANVPLLLPSFAVDRSTSEERGGSLGSPDGPLFHRLERTGEGASVMAGVDASALCRVEVRRERLGRRQAAEGFPVFDLRRRRSGAVSVGIEGAPAGDERLAFELDDAQLIGLGGRFCRVDLNPLVQEDEECEHRSESGEGDNARLLAHCEAPMQA